jgi:hypothetical protein
MRKNSNPEFQRFDKTMDALLSVTHDDLKAALDAEKAEKLKKKRKPKTSASGRASRATKD